jgi:NAD(P)-dependent dehydrogenase (short-subunit alcohol dehydrogenase family)
MPEALIWGASGGMGAALVSLLKAESWRVFAAARDESRIPEHADLLCTFDAAKSYTFNESAMRVGMESSGVDLVVYAAGGLAASPIADMRPEAWTQTIESNLTGALYAAQVSVPLMREGGHFMVIGAYIDHLILPKFAAYAAAKAGLEPLIGILAKEHRKHKFTVVHPGAVDTPFWKNAPFSLPKNAKSPAVVARAILDRYQSGESGKLDL